jgi:hypothetical protein
MKSLPILVFLEFKKVLRNTKSLSLPVLFYMIVLVIMITLVPLTPETQSIVRICFWIMVSLSLKLSFGSFIQEDAERNLIKMLMVQGYSLNKWVLLKVFISTLIFSALFMAIFLGLALSRLLFIEDILMVPVLIGSLLTLQMGVEVVTLKTKAARYLSYLLLLPLEIPLLILVVSENALSLLQLVKTLGGYLMLSVGLLVGLTTFVFNRHKNTCIF